MNKHELAAATFALSENPAMILQVTKRNKEYYVYPVDGEHDSFRDTRYEHTVGFIGKPMGYNELIDWLQLMEKGFLSSRKSPKKTHSAKIEK